MAEIGEEVEIASGDVRGTVSRVVTEGSVFDPLLGETFTASADDPVLMLDTPDGPVAVVASETKDVPIENGQGWDELVGVFTEHERKVLAERLPSWALPSGSSLKAVFTRGLKSWPGATVTNLKQQDWALARARAFLDASAGQGRPGYCRDVDLLPVEHPDHPG